VNRDDWRGLIKEAFPDAYDYADAAIIIDRSLCVVFFSDGASAIFGYDSIGIERSSIDLIECPALSTEFLNREFNFFVAQLTSRELFSHRGRPVRAGEPLTAKDYKGRDVLVRAGVHPIEVASVLHLIIFFQQIRGKNQSQNDAALTSPSSPFHKKMDGADAKPPDSSNPWVFGLQTILFLYRFSPPLFLLVLLLGVGGFGIYQADNVLKIFNKLIDHPREPIQQERERGTDVSEFEVF
jgi:hypothetical protein